MADGTFYSGRGGLECLCHLGVQYFGDGIDDIHIVDGDDDGFPQVLIALDVGGNADFVDDAGDQAFDVILVHPAAVRVTKIFTAPDFFQPFHQRGHITGLQHQVPNPEIGCGGRNVFGNEAGGGQGDGLPVQIGNGFQNADAVLFCQHQIQHQNIGFSLLDHADGLLPIRGCPHYLKTLGPLQCGSQPGAKVLSAVGDENGGCMFHTFLSCHVNSPQYAVVKPRATPKE